MNESLKLLNDISKKSCPIKQYLKNFLVRYEQLFTPIRYHPLTILEIGIGGYKNRYKGGGALKMWAEFLPNSTIIGLDSELKQLELPDNVKVELGSQIDTQLLNNLAYKYGRFDIVIDDASHIKENTIVTFETLWPHTRRFYIVEDLHMAKAKGTKEYFQHIKEADFNTPNMCVVSRKGNN